MERLSDTKKWRETQENNTHHYFNNIENNGCLPDYNVVADKLNNNFKKFISKVDRVISDK